MKIAGRELGTQEYNAVVVNLSWRDGIVGDKHQEMHWMRSILMRHLQASGVQVTNVRRMGGYWEMTCGSGAWSRISDIFNPSEIIK